MNKKGAAIATLTILILGLTSVYAWLSTKWTDFYTEAEMRHITKEIESTSPLPDNFYNAYDKMYPNQRNKTLAKMSFQAIWYLLTKNKEKLSNYRQCNCIVTTNFFERKVPANYHSWAPYITAHGLEKHTTEAKCLDFNFRKSGIDSLANKYFSKPLDELTIDESIELILRSNNPVIGKKSSS